MSQSEYKLYAADLSLYSGKARSYLRYKGVPFQNNLSPKKIKDLIGYVMLPVLQTPEGKVIQDTSEIIDELEQVHTESNVVPDTPKQRVASLLLELYGDEWLLIPAMYYRWQYNRDFALAEFGAIAGRWLPRFIRYRIGEKLSAKFAGALPKLGIHEHMYQPIEDWYESFLQHLNAHFAEHDFLLGSRPCIGDYGFMGPLYAHLYRDPESGKLMKRMAPNVAKWVERMNDPIPNSGTFLDNDQIPETLNPIFERLFAEHMPVVLDTVAQTEGWLGKNTETPLPRVLGERSFAIGGTEAKREIFPYVQWMFQRPLDAYQALDEQDKAKVDEWLSQFEGAQQSLQTQIEKRVVRENFKLVPA